MPSAARNSLKRLAAQVLDAEHGDRYVPLGVELREWGARGSTLLEVGGCWDKRAGRWAGNAEHVAIWQVQPAQYEAARWFARWLEAYVAGAPLVEDDEVRTILLAGGRRGGKSDFMVKALAMTALAVPRSLVWLISEVQEETDELKAVLDAMMPTSWYHYAETDEIYRLWNGSQLAMMSGYKPSSLKRGRVDFWGINEGQKFPRKAYTILRAPLADRRGLGFVTANPPDEPKGRWVMDVHEVAVSGHAGWKLFAFDARKNPTVDWATLEAMRNDPAVSEEEYRREILGEFLPIGDLVFHAWSAREWDPATGVGNIRALPELGEATRDFTRARLGRSFEAVVCADFQTHPHMAATVWQVFRDDKGEWLSWIVDEVVVEQGTEHDLVDALEAHGLSSDRTAIIGDASGEWQDAERTRGRGSFDVLRQRGWRHLYLPDPKTKKNPDVIATCRVANGLMRGADGARRLFSAPSNVHTNAALSRWENRRGMPHKRSPYAHLGDTVRYWAWRFFPRQAKQAVEYQSLAKRTRRSQMRGL